MKAIIIYNTRSGNTELLAEKIKEILEKNGHECEIYRDKKIKKTPNIVEGFDILCLGSCAHFFGPAFSPFRGLLKKFAKLDLKDKKLIAFGTSGGPNGWQQVCKHIQKKVPQLEHLGSFGCIKRENEDLFVDIEKFVKDL